MKFESQADLKIFAANLQYLMLRKKCKIEDLAIDMEISIQRVHSWLQAICFPKYEMMVKLCQYFSYYDIYALVTKKISDVQNNIEISDG